MRNLLFMIIMRDTHYVIFGSSKRTNFHCVYHPKKQQ